MKIARFKLMIADILIEMRSKFPLEKLSEEELKGVSPERFQNFVSKSRKRPDISINVLVSDKLPDIGKAERLFVMWRKPDRLNNWQLWRSDKGYVFKCNVMGNKQVIFINKSFDRAEAHLLSSKKRGNVWYPTEIIYDFLQVLLIHYIARNNLGFFIHSAGVTDRRGRGYIFAGRSGAGKSTLARILYKDKEMKVLNDDRVALRRIGGRYFIYGLPWHGEFTDYMKSHHDRAGISRIYFIRHDTKNSIAPMPAVKAFRRLYPTIFLPFWDKEGLDNISSFCATMLGEIPFFDMGFVKSETVAGFISKANSKR